VKNPRFRIFDPLSQALSSSDMCSVLFDRSTSDNAEVRENTSSIIQRVRQGGDTALRSLARELDGVNLESIEVPRERLSTALAAIPPELRRAMQRSADNIRRVHEAVPPFDIQIESEPGIAIWRRAHPFDRVGIYAPGGRASYPSSVLMCAIPAHCAGVKEIILCSPPAHDGAPPASVLAAAALSGVHRVFALGGAGAVAAMAFGTQTVPRVQRIVGPGNAYVAEAKLQLSGYASFESPAGPSELLVVADDTANPTVVAREMMAQAEHDPLAAVAVVCTSREFAGRVGAEVEELLARSSRREIITASLASRGAIVWCDEISEAVDFVSSYAPEHLLIIAARATWISESVRNCGTVFIGECSSVAFGDYMTGANHVLPSGSLARSYSGLSTSDFVRVTTYQRVSPEAAATLAGDVSAFATAENLPAHAAAAAAWGGQRV
jgi:histidinol dehydrogenase